MSDIFDYDLLDYEEDQSDIHDSSISSEIFSKELADSLKSRFQDVVEIWNLIGLPSNKRGERIESLVAEVDRFVEEQKKLLNDCQNFKEHKLKEINKILSDLSLPSYSLPEEPKKLLSQIKILQNKYKDLLEIKTDRMNTLERIESRLKKVCHLLGISYEPTIFSTDIPNEMELKSLALILNNNEKILSDRKIQYDSMISIIQNLKFEMEYNSENDDEKMVFNTPKEEFIFSQSNMIKLIDLQKKLITMYNDYKVKISKLTTTLEQLYNRLDIPLKERDLFLNNLVGTFPQQENSLKNEIVKYEIIKKNSIEKIIKKIREELNTLIHKCFVIKFDDSLMESEDYTEDLLIKLELEYEKLKQYHDCYGIIFQKFIEWEDSLEQLIELEKKSTDPNRFNNRGGALLQIERDRKMLTRKLPRLEKEIRSMVAQIEEENVLPFNSYGLDIDKFFQKNWSHFEECKKDQMKLTKSSTIAKKNYGSAKKIISSSAQKSRVPFSPRTNNQKDSSEERSANGSCKRNLNSDFKKAYDPLELHFQMALQKDTLHSTMLDLENNPPHFGSPKRLTPFRHGQLRRRSKSCENLSPRPRLGMTNRNVTNGSQSKNRPIIECVTKRRPFLP